MVLRNLGQPEVRQAILERLERLQPDVPPRWGRMSASGMICHLSDTFRFTAGEKPVRPISTLYKRTVFKYLALYLPLKWPPGVRTPPDVAQDGGGTKPTQFDADRQELVRLIDRFCANPPDRRGAAHPIFGPMTRAQWLRWAYLHMEHHLRQFGV